MFLSAYRASPTRWSILYLKLVLIFLCSLKPSHSTSSFFLFGIFGDKSTLPEAKQNRRNNGASLRHVFSHSGWLVTMSWCSPRNNRKYQLFAPFYNEKTLTVPLRNVSKLVRREDHLSVWNIPKFKDRASWSCDTFQPMRRRACVYQQTNQNIAPVLKNFQNNGRSRRTELPYRTVPYLTVLV